MDEIPIMLNILTINGMEVPFAEMNENGFINFKFDRIWRDPLDFITPNITALEFILRIHCFPDSVKDWKEKHGFASVDNPKQIGPASKSEVRRWLQNSAIRFNGRTMNPKDMLDFPLYSVIMFPKTNRITLL